MCEQKKIIQLVKTRREKNDHVYRSRVNDAV